MRPGIWFGAAAGLLGSTSCASLVGADFDSEHLAAADAGAHADAGVPDGGPSEDGPSGDSSACPTGLTSCDGLCVDIQTDPHHCGACAEDCPTDPNGSAVCVAASCTFACMTGWLRCSAGCCDADAGPPPDAQAPEGGSSDPGVACGPIFCPVSDTSYCCGDWLDGPGGDVCTTSASANCNWAFSCDDGSECSAGEVCCYDNHPDQRSSGCAVDCSDPLDLIFCNPDSSGACPDGLACTGVFSDPNLQTAYGYCE